MKEITVALVVKNVARDIQQIIERLLDQNCSKEKYEILVIDTGSTDSTHSILARYGEKIRVMGAQTTLGRARYLALKHAKSDIVAFLDGDVIPPRNLVSRILEAFEKDNSVVAAHWPSITYPDKGFFYKCMAAIYEAESATGRWPGRWPGYKVMKRCGPQSKEK